MTPAQETKSILVFAGNYNQFREREAELIELGYKPIFIGSPHQALGYGEMPYIRLGEWEKSPAWKPQLLSVWGALGDEVKLEANK